MFNLRDIGGLAAEGGTIRRGLLLRSNALVDLGESGRRELSELGLATAVDLREPGERTTEPSDLDGLDVTLHEQPLVDGAGEAMTPELLAFNLWLLDERGDRLVAVVRLLSSPGALPAVYFCTSGKDRTGLLSALILSALGVQDEAVIRDYALSETLFPEGHRERALQQALAGGMSESHIDAWHARALTSPAPVMQGTLGHLADEYGGAAQYLVDSGLRAEELDELRAKLVGNA